MLPRIFSEIFNGIWAIHKPIADSYMPLVASILEGTFQNNDTQIFESKEENGVRFAAEVDEVFTISEYGRRNSPEEAPKNSIAILNITDVISKYDMECGPSGTKTKGNLLQRADNNSNIKGILLNIDSGGGEGYASMDLSRIIKSLNTPVISFIDDLAASAAYWIASSTPWIVANTKMAQVGSIGTYVTIADYEKFFENKGIKLHEIYADKSVDKNKDYYDALKGNYKLIKEKVNVFNEEFLTGIKENRGSKIPDEKIWGTGKLFNADEAERIGLIDEIATFEDTILSFAKTLNI